MPKNRFRYQKLTNLANWCLHQGKWQICPKRDCCSKWFLHQGKWQICSKRDCCPNWFSHQGKYQICPKRDCCCCGSSLVGALQIADPSQTLISIADNFANCWLCVDFGRAGLDLQALCRSSTELRIIRFQGAGILGMAGDGGWTI